MTVPSPFKTLEVHLVFKSATVNDEAKKFGEGDGRIRAVETETFQRLNNVIRNERRRRLFAATFPRI